MNFLRRNRKPPQTEAPAPSATASTPWEQKRQAPRVECERPVECTVDGETWAAATVDASMTGLRLAVPRELVDGHALLVRSPLEAKPSGYPNDLDVDTVKALVVWCRRRQRDQQIEVGVTFTEAADVIRRSWVGAALYQAGLTNLHARDQRRHVRFKCSLPAQAAGGAGAGIPGRVLNVGVGGCLFEGELALRKGQPVRMSIGPLGELPAMTLRGRTVYCSMQTGWLAGLGRAARMVSPTPLAATEDKRQRIGVEFTLGESDAELLIRYLHELAKAN